MKFNNAIVTADTRRGQRSFWLLRLLLVSAIVLLVTAPGFAGSAQHGRKIAPDFTKLPANPNALIDVIIQFNQTPQARHFQFMAANGGKLKFKLMHIRGAAYRIPVKMLTFLENHPDIGYVSPDRRNKPAFDDAASAALADIARQQYGLDGSGVGVAVIDSGVYNHDDLRRAGSSGGSRIVYSESFVPNDGSANDAYGHGTHVA